MAKTPDGMTVLEVLPHNYDRILELSKDLSPWEEGYTVEKLDQIRAKAWETNNVAYVMFMDPSFWSQRVEPGTTQGE